MSKLYIADIIYQVYILPKKGEFNKQNRMFAAASIELYGFLDQFNSDWLQFSIKLSNLA